MDLLDDRFEIIGEIGRGSQAVTHRAKDHETGEDVALKELDFRRVEDWKSQELFEREGKTLQSLSHAAIPRYVAAFAVETDDSIRLFLAQEFVEGPTLEEELAAGKRWTESDVIADAKRVLDALAYLHDCMPPVIHRDIKPSNMIRRADGSIALVDFGAAQNALPRTVGGSTVIGTPGYMPMEQLMGRSVPATDLYAFGATLIHLLSGTEPAALPVERNRLLFADRVRCGPLLRRVLERLTQPSVEDRYPDAATVLRDLNRSFEAPTLPTGGDDSSGEFAPDLGGDPSAEIEHHTGRTMNFPGWSQPQRPEDGVFVLEFETRDADEHEVRIQVRDEPGGLTLHAWVDETNVAVERVATGWAPIAAACVLVVICWSFAPGLVPMALVGAMAILLAKIASEDDEHEPDIELRIGPEDIHLIRADEFRMRTPTRQAKLFAERSELKLRTDREVPVIALSRHNAYQAEWLAKHLTARAREIAAGGEVELEFPDSDSDVGERQEFWKEAPATVSSK